MNATNPTIKDRFLAGDQFVGRRNRQMIFRFNSEENTIEKWVHAGNVWDYHCLANKITDKGITGTISFLGVNIVSRIFEFKDLIFIEETVVANPKEMAAEL